MRDITYYLTEHLKWMRITNHPAKSIMNKKYHLNIFIKFIEDLKVNKIEDINHEIIREYQQYMSYKISRFGKPFEIRSQNRALIDIRSFLRWLVHEDYLVSDPSARIQYAKEPDQLPRNVLTEPEIIKLLKQPDMQTISGYRDRIILEILYTTGMRKSELGNIKIIDIDCTDGYIRIDQGKGKKDRVVPIGNIACKLADTYIKGIRIDTILPVFREKDLGYFIPNNRGGKLHPNKAWETVRHYSKKAGFKKKITPHCLRHTCASHMLKNGADIRYIQEMLGHVSLKTTQIYTRLTLTDLKEVHRKCHPRDIDK